MKVACFSVAVMDFYPQQNKYYAGGNSLNQAICYSQMGHQSAFVGAIGTDDAGNRINTLLQNELVDISCLYQLEGKTASNKIINDSEGERFGVKGAWDSGVYGEFKLKESDWDFIRNFDIWATHANSPCYEEALKRNRENQLMSVDFLHLTDYELLRKSFEVIDIAFFGGTHEMIEDLSSIAKELDRLIVLTLGKDGSIAFDGNKKYIQESLATEKVIDTTGCGDAFQAGFTACYADTNNVKKALLAGAKLGKKALTHFGGVSGNKHTI